MPLYMRRHAAMLHVLMCMVVMGTLMQSVSARGTAHAYTPPADGRPAPIGASHEPTAARGPIGAWGEHMDLHIMQDARHALAEQGEVECAEPLELCHDGSCAELCAENVAEEFSAVFATSGGPAGDVADAVLDALLVRLDGVTVAHANASVVTVVAIPLNDTRVRVTLVVVGADVIEAIAADGVFVPLGAPLEDRIDIAVEPRHGVLFPGDHALVFVHVHAEGPRVGVDSCMVNGAAVDVHMFANGTAMNGTLVWVAEYEMTGASAFFEHGALVVACALYDDVGLDVLTDAEHMRPNTLGGTPHACNASTDCSGAGTCVLDGCACAESNMGVSCEECMPGFFGDGGARCSPCPGGASNACHGQGVCSNTTGVCTCDADYFLDDCSAYCFAPDTCGDRGLCSFEGECVCIPPNSGVNCELCPPNVWGPLCDRPCATCSETSVCDRHTGNCTCGPGYYGALCDVYCDATATCNNGAGSCDEVTGACVCGDAFSGTHCELCRFADTYGPACDVVCTRDTTCNARGDCNADTGACECEQGWAGDECDECAAGFWEVSDDECTPCTGYTEGLGACSGHGTCSDEDGSCACDNDYFGDGCATFCSFGGKCSSHGVCDGAGACICQTGYVGDTCAACGNGYYGAEGEDCSPCPGGADTPCSSRGVCNSTSGQCTCSGGYRGDACDVDAIEFTAVYVLPDTGNLTVGNTYEVVLQASGQEGGLVVPDAFYCRVNTMTVPVFDDGGGRYHVDMIISEGDPTFLDGELTIDCWMGDREGNVLRVTDFTQPNTLFGSGVLCDRKNKCSGRGTCNRFGDCECEALWQEPYCSFSRCPEDCNNNGDCNDATGECTCTTPGAMGDSCVTDTPLDLLVAAASMPTTEQVLDMLYTMSRTTAVDQRVFVDLITDTTSLNVYAITARLRALVPTDNTLYYWLDSTAVPPLSLSIQRFTLDGVVIVPSGGPAVSDAVVTPNAGNLVPGDSITLTFSATRRHLTARSCVVNGRDVAAQVSPLSVASTEYAVVFTLGEHEPVFEEGQLSVACVLEDNHGVAAPVAGVEANALFGTGRVCDDARTCHGHGACNKYGFCECFDLWILPNCSSSDCPGNCSAQGVCNSDTGVCACVPGGCFPDCSVLNHVHLASATLEDAGARVSVLTSALVEGPGTAWGDNAGHTVGEAFACGLLFTQWRPSTNASLPFGTHTTCSWVSGRELRIDVGIDEVGLRALDQLRVRPHALRLRGATHGSCAYLEPAINVSAPAHAGVRLELSAPRTIAPCDDIHVEVVVAAGASSHAFDVQWSVRLLAGEPSANETAERVALVAAATAANALQLHLPGRVLGSNPEHVRVSVLITCTYINHVLGIEASEGVSVLRTERAVPVLVLDTAVSTLVNEPLRLRAAAQASSCRATASPGLTYVWSLVSGSVFFEIPSALAIRRDLVLPAHSLVAGGQYQFKLSSSYVGEPASEGTSVNVIVDVASQPMHMFIAGPEHREVAGGDAAVVSVDASRVTLPDDNAQLSDDFALTWHYTCDACGEALGNALAALDASMASFALGLLAVDTPTTVHAEVRAVREWDGAVYMATDTVVLTRRAEVSAPWVWIDEVYQYNVSPTPLRVHGHVGGGTAPLTLQWTVVEPVDAVDMQSGVLASPDATSASLALHGAALPSNVDMVLMLRVEDAHGVEAEARVRVFVNEPPRAGSVLVSEVVGVGADEREVSTFNRTVPLLSRLRLAVSGAFDASSDGPLQYSFGYQYAADGPVYRLSAANPAPVLVTEALPAGTQFVVAYVEDRWGALAQTPPAAVRVGGAAGALTAANVTAAAEARRAVGDTEGVFALVATGARALRELGGSTGDAQQLMGTLRDALTSADLSNVQTLAVLADAVRSLSDSVDGDELVDDAVDVLQDIASASASLPPMTSVLDAVVSAVDSVLQSLEAAATNSARTARAAVCAGSATDRDAAEAAEAVLLDTAVHHVRSMVCGESLASVSTGVHLRALRETPGTIGSTTFALQGGQQVVLSESHFASWSSACVGVVLVGQGEDAFAAATLEPRNSGLVSAYVLDAGVVTPLASLADPVVVVVLPLTTPMGALEDPLCTFWDEGTCAWSSEGCVVSAAGTDVDQVTCECTHLTTFGVGTMLGCPLECSSRGACVEGVCQCVAPYQGESCVQDSRFVPAAVASPQVVAVTHEQVTLEWAAPADRGFALESYTVQLAAAGEPFADVFSGLALGAVIDGLDASTNYTVRVSATNFHGMGAFSPLVRVLTQPPPTPTPSPVPSPTPTPSSDNDEEAIVGGTVGGGLALILLVVIGVVAVLSYKKRKKVVAQRRFERRLETQLSQLGRFDDERDRLMELAVTTKKRELRDEFELRDDDIMLDDIEPEVIDRSKLPPLPFPACEMPREDPRSPQVSSLPLAPDDSDAEDEGDDDVGAEAAGSMRHSSAHSSGMGGNTQSGRSAASSSVHTLSSTSSWVRMLGEEAEETEV